MIPKHYEGREQAYIKHKLLEAYLERLFMIVGQHEKTICYIDCFAGPWQEQTEDMDDTSIAISLKIINKCREGLTGLGKDVCFRALFIEKNKKSFQKLEVFLNRDEWSGVETKALCGEFHELRHSILEWCGTKDFAFFFIDPKGWKNVVEISTLSPFLKRPKSEFLINFMYEFLLRAHSNNDFEKHMREIFGEVPNTYGMTPEAKETHLMSLYLQFLKKNSHENGGGKPRSVYMKIKDPLIDRTKYVLVYLTRHALGIKVFMEASEKLDLVQRKVRAEAKQKKRERKTGQLELFADHEAIRENGGNIDLSELKSYWLKKLSFTSKRFGIEELAEMLEEMCCFVSDFQSAFQELQDEGKVRNLEAKRKRPVNAVRFNGNNGKGEFLEKVNK